MITAGLIALALIVLVALVRREAGALSLIIALGVLSALSYGLSETGLMLLFGALALLLVVTGLPLLRMWLSAPMFKIFKKIAPKVSETEQVALDAGTVSWDGELFTGRPNWDMLLGYKYGGLSQEEQAFLDKQCEYAVSQCNGWDLAVERADLPEHVWDYLRKEKFFGMIIPKKYGGLDFSAKAQSAVLQKLSSNEMLMVTVGVPNSLGPGELLVKYGTEDQKDYYLPRLADGREIPCFGLTGPRAGSDATSLPDTGIVCKGEYEGKEVLGIKLNFEKRWITLAPVATVVGLAFRMFDPDNLLGKGKDRGITCALVPRDTKGMEIGRRHCPTGSPFMNGPIKGKDVFIPLDFIIGGEKMAGEGWRMLVECLSVGRCITLPSGAAGSSAFAAATSGGFTRIRRQFNTPVADMEGVQQPLARIAAHTYIAQAAVNHTATLVDNGEKPSVPSAILKYHLTELQRDVLADAMDVHGGKTVTLGPRNYLGIGNNSAPVSITVEGANIMTRSLMIFGQGAIRCHPYVLDELAAKDSDDLKGFDKALFKHIGLVFGNALRGFTQAFGLGKGYAPFDSVAKPYAQEINRFSSAFGLCADAAMATLGAQLKMRELLSARLGDVLSNMYLGSMVIKNWNESDKVEGEQQVFEYAMQLIMARIELALDEFLQNLPNRPVAFALRVLTMPLGKRWDMPHDDESRSIARLLSTDTPLRTQLTKMMSASEWKDGVDNPVAQYKQLLQGYDKAEKIYRTVTKAYAKGKLPMEALHPEQRFEEAHKAGILDKGEFDFIQEYEKLVLEMLTVDDFEFDAFAREKEVRPAKAS